MKELMYYALLDYRGIHKELALEESELNNNNKESGNDASGACGLMSHVTTVILGVMIRGCCLKEQ